MIRNNTKAFATEANAEIVRKAIVASIKPGGAFMPCKKWNMSMPKYAR